MGILFPYVFENGKREQNGIMKNVVMWKENTVLFCKQSSGKIALIFTVDRKMTKQVTKIQLGILLDRLEEKPEIARGLVRCDKIDKFWQDLTTAVNASGPPVKTPVEWKRVWNDQKKYVRKKAQQNAAARKKTGGGAYAEKEFSATEQRIYDLTSMELAVEGVEKGQAFGAGLQEAIHDLLTPPATPTLPKENKDLRASMPAATNSIEVTLKSSTGAMPQRHVREARSNSEKISTASLLQKELQTQQSILEAMNSLVKIGKERNAIELQKLAETKRHNRQMEKMRRLK